MKIDQHEEHLYVDNQSKKVVIEEDSHEDRSSPSPI